MWRSWSLCHSTRNFMCHFFQFGFIGLAIKSFYWSNFSSKFEPFDKYPLLLLTTFWKYHSSLDVQSTTGPAPWHFELCLRFTTLHTLSLTPFLLLTRTTETTKITATIIRWNARNILMSIIIVIIRENIVEVHSRYPLVFSFSSPSPMESPSCAFTRSSRNTARVANHWSMFK